MGAKGKAKANANPFIGKAKSKGKATPKGKANVKGKAYGHDKGHAPLLGWNCIQASQPLGKTGSNTVKYQVQALVARDPEKITPLMQHYEGLNKHSDKLKFALQLKT